MAVTIISHLICSNPTDAAIQLNEQQELTQHRLLGNWFSTVPLKYRGKLILFSVHCSRSLSLHDFPYLHGTSLTLSLGRWVEQLESQGESHREKTPEDMEWTKQDGRHREREPSNMTAVKTRINRLFKRVPYRHMRLR